MEYKHKINLKEHSSMYIGGISDFSTVLEDEAEIEEISAYAKANNLKIWIIGEGTNTIFSDNPENIFFIINKIKGISIINESENSVVIEVGAGENWDEFVKYTVDNNFVRLEALSFIPGSVGATPIQNVGAYGTEVKDVIDSVKVFDIQKEQFYWMKNVDCEFEYRNSIFKKNPEKYIVTKVTFKLSKNPPRIPDYPDIKNYFDNHAIENPSIMDIRNAIIETRKSKLLDYREIPNCGSFFANPIVDEKKLEILKTKYPDIKSFNASGGRYKISAGWLIEQAGLKGQKLGNISVSEKHALILCNHERIATFKDLEKAETEIQKIIKEKFDIELIREPVVCL